LPVGLHGRDALEQFWHYAFVGRSRWDTSTKASPVSVGILRKKLVKTSRDPADPPIPMMVEAVITAILDSFAVLFRRSWRRFDDFILLRNLVVGFM